MTAALPQTHLERLPKAGHIAPLDNPRGLLEIIDRFLTAEE